VAEQAAGDEGERVVVVGELLDQALRDGPQIAGSLEAGLVRGRIQGLPCPGADPLQGRDRHVRAGGEVRVGGHLAHAGALGDGVDAGAEALLDDGPDEGVDQFLGNLRVMCSAHGLVFYSVETMSPLADTGLRSGEATAAATEVAACKSLARRACLRFAVGVWRGLRRTSPGPGKGVR
jgi:hypothetical protein